LSAEGTRAALPRLLCYTLAAGMLFGGVMGTFGGLAGDRGLQIVYSALKLPLLLLATFALSLPSFFVLNTLLGLRSDFAAVLRGLVSAQAGLTLVLAGLAPYTAFWYASSGDYNAAILFNGVLLGIASVAAQFQLRRYYRPLIGRNARHRLLLRTWLVLYAFVGIQMGWVLRPFVGAPEMPVQFFRAESWGSAYVVVLRLAWRVLGP
jgi:hypothetical protein